MTRRRRPFFSDSFFRFDSIFEDILDDPGVTRTINVSIDGAVPISTKWESTDKECTLYVPLPGLTKDDVSVKIEGSSLVVTAETKQEDANRAYASNYKHSWNLHSHHDAENISSEMKDGMLIVTVPLKKAAKPKARDIPVL